MLSGEPFGFPRDGRIVGATRQEVADLALDRQHAAQPRPAAQGVKHRGIGAGAPPAAHQAAARVVKRVAINPARCATAEAVLVEVLHHGRVRQRVVALMNLRRFGGSPAVCVKLILQTEALSD